MPSLKKLLSVFKAARQWLAHPDNDFSWSAWHDQADALAEIDRILAKLRSGVLPGSLTLEVLFAPTGSIQAVSLSSGWGDEFIAIAQQFDDAMLSANPDGNQNEQLESLESCECFVAPSTHLSCTKELGLDNQFAEVSILICQACGQHWLRYFYEVEGFTRSGRWYLGAISAEQASTLTLDQAKETLEQINWYYYGGSYYEGQSAKTLGRIGLHP